MSGQLYDAMVHGRTDERTDGPTDRRTQCSGVGLDREGVAVRILEPRDASAAGSGGDALSVMYEVLVADEADAGGGEFVDDFVDVVDVPGRQRRRGLPSCCRLVHVQGWATARTVNATAIGDLRARSGLHRLQTK